MMAWGKVKSLDWSADSAHLAYWLSARNLWDVNIDCNVYGNNNEGLPIARDTIGLLALGIG